MQRKAMCKLRISAVFQSPPHGHVQIFTNMHCIYIDIILVQTALNYLIDLDWPLA